jgi:hypothetical protein
VLAATVLAACVEAGGELVRVCPAAP